MVNKRICFLCGSDQIENLQPNQWACKSCRTHYKTSDISQEEMIEWFCD